MTRFLEGQIYDYAARHYSGLADYYTSRWNFFFEFADKNGCGTKVMENQFPAEILKVEQKYMHAATSSTVRTENYWQVVQDVYHYYCIYLFPQDCKIH